MWCGECCGLAWGGGGGGAWMPGLGQFAEEGKILNHVGFPPKIQIVTAKNNIKLALRLLLRQAPHPATLVCAHLKRRTNP